MTRLPRLGVDRARRIALAAQGFADPPHVRPTMRTLQRTVNRTGVVQVDSVNVLQRAHFMPLYSRMGPYDVGLLRRAAERRPRRLVEYWAHVQALMPVDLWPVMHHRMEFYRRQRGKWWRGISESLADELLAAISERGASTARDLDDGAPRSKDHWGWNWSEARKGLDYLFMIGDVAAAGRNSQFELRYDLPERVLPAEVLARPVPSREAAAVELVRRAARSHGVATARDLRDYYRMGAAETQGAIATLLANGELVPVEVERLGPALLHAEAAQPRSLAARALLSPFDPVVWERSRAEALFDFRYRIEIYVPAAQRVHGYYVLPFLLGDRFVARTDLKADRSRGTLVVKAAYAEPSAPPETALELAAELWRLAGWLDLDRIEVLPHGDLAAALAAAV